MELKSFHALLYIKRKQQYNIVSYLRVGKEAVSTRKKKKPLHQSPCLPNTKESTNANFVESFCPAEAPFGIISMFINVENV